MIPSASLVTCNSQQQNKMYVIHSKHVLTLKHTYYLLGKSANVLLFMDSSKPHLHIWIIGNLDSPSTLLYCMEILLTDNTSAPVINIRNSLSWSFSIPCINCFRKFYTVCSNVVLWFDLNIANSCFVSSWSWSRKEIIAETEDSDYLLTHWLRCCSSNRQRNNSSVQFLYVPLRESSFLCFCLDGDVTNKVYIISF